MTSTPTRAKKLHKVITSAQKQIIVKKHTPRGIGNLCRRRLQSTTVGSNTIVLTRASTLAINS